MTPKPNIKLLLALVSRLGIKVELGQGVLYTPLNSIGYKGRVTINSNFRRLMEDPDEEISSIIKSLAHEIGHYVVCPKGRRRYKDFGLGSVLRDDQKGELEDVKANLVMEDILERINMPLTKPQRVNRRKNKEAVKWFESDGKKLVDNIFWVV